MKKAKRTQIAQRLKTVDPNIFPKDLFKDEPAVQGPLTPQEYKIKQRLTRVKPVLYFKKG